MDLFCRADILYQFANTLTERNIDERPEHVRTYLRALGVIQWPLMAIVLFFTAHSERSELPAGSLFLPLICPIAPRWSLVPPNICNTAEPWGKGPGVLPPAAAPAGFSPAFSLWGYSGNRPPRGGLCYWDPKPPAEQGLELHHNWFSVMSQQSERLPSHCSATLNISEMMDALMK